MVGGFVFAVPEQVVVNESQILWSCEKPLEAGENLERKRSSITNFCEALV